jgi:hypothetical protein
MTLTSGPEAKTPAQSQVEQHLAFKAELGGIRLIKSL